MYRLPSLYHDGPEPRLRAARPRARRAVLFAALAAALIGCDDPAGSQGPVLATLVSPNGSEGAALFELPVDGVLEAKALDGQSIEVIRGGRRQIAVFRKDPGVIALRLVVSDQTRLPEVLVVQVAGPDDRPRALTGYRVVLAVAP